MKDTMNAIEQAIGALDHILKMQIRGFIVIGDKATSQAREAITALQSMQGEAVVKVNRNLAGQIHLTNPDGSAFDMSKHIGATFYTHPQSPSVPDGYVVVRDTTESMSTNSLSDKLQYWRAMRPDEWAMDEFIRDAQVLEVKAMLTASGKGE